MFCDQCGARCNRVIYVADAAAKPCLDSSSFGVAGFASMSDWWAFSGWRTRHCTWLQEWS